MTSGDFADRVAGVAALAEPIRRDLYLFVAGQPDAVSRDQAAAGVGVPRHTAKFHLDKLVEEGLLATEFRRLSGRRGPGAGRPAKLYRRAGGEVSVSLPDRRYDLAGQLMAQAIEESVRDGGTRAEAVHRAAAERREQRWRRDARESRPPTNPRIVIAARCCEPLQPAATSHADTTTTRSPGQLPLPRPGQRTHGVGVRHEPCSHRCGRGPIGSQRPSSPPKPGHGPLLRGAHGSLMRR